MLRCCGFWHTPLRQNGEINLLFMGTSKKELFPSFSCSKKMPFGKWQSNKLTSIVKIDLQFMQFYKLIKC